MDISKTCRMSGYKGETVSHILSECKQLSEKEYTGCGHDKVAAMLHWDVCKKMDLNVVIKVMNTSLIMRKGFGE